MLEVQMNLMVLNWKLFGIVFDYHSVEAGMIALNRGGTFLIHEDFIEGIAVVQAKKKSSLNYYAWFIHT